MFIIYLVIAHYKVRCYSLQSVISFIAKLFITIVNTRLVTHNKSVIFSYCQSLLQQSIYSTQNIVMFITNLVVTYYKVSCYSLQTTTKHCYVHYKLSSSSLPEVENPLEQPVKCLIKKHYKYYCVAQRSPFCHSQEGFEQRRTPPTINGMMSKYAQTISESLETIFKS